MAYLFYKRHLAELEDALKDARKKDHEARADSLRKQIKETRKRLFEIARTGEDEGTAEHMMLWGGHR